MVDAAWKAADHGKDEVVVSDVLSFSANDDEGVTKSFIVLLCLIGLVYYLRNQGVFENIPSSCYTSFNNPGVQS